MSLNSAQWELMWGYVKRIEKLAYAPELPPVKRQRILNEVERIKELIQQVIGQME